MFDSSPGPIYRPSRALPDDACFRAVHTYRMGAPRCQNTLATNLYPWVRARVRREMRGLAEELVKEMVNEALFKIVRFIDRLRADTVAGVRSWLGLVTVSTARSVLRKEARHLRIAEADAAPAGGEGCSEDWLSGNLAHGHALEQGAD